MNRQLIRPELQAEGTTRCSALEQQFRAIYPTMAFFYREQLDPEKLRRALSRVLSDFPLYAGKLRTVDGAPQIEHSVVGAAFERVQTSTPLHMLEASGNAGRADVLGPRISFMRAVFGRESLLAARLTSAPDGCCLCVTWNHSVGDLHSTMLLMRAWADAYNDRAHEKPTIVLDRLQFLQQELSDPPEVEATVRLVSWRQIIDTLVKIGGPSKRTVIEYSWEQLEAIRAVSSRTRRVSANDALCMRVFAVIRQLAGATEPANLCLTVNYRKRVGIADSCVGNFVNVVAQPMHAGDDAAEAAAGLRNQLDHFATRAVDFHACMRVFDAHPSPLQRMRVVSTQFVPGKGHLLVTNWTGFGAYDLVFGSERPTRFCSLSKLPPYFMVVYELPDSAGLGVQVSLPPRLAAQLDSDAGRALLMQSAPAIATHAPVAQSAV